MEKQGGADSIFLIVRTRDFSGPRENNKNQVGCDRIDRIRL